MAFGLNLRLCSKLPWIKRTLSGSPMGFVKVQKLASCASATAEIMQVELKTIFFLSWVISQEIHTTKNVQARPPKNGAAGAKGPLNCASANPIQGKPVNTTLRRYSINTQEAASTGPVRYLPLGKQRESEALEKNKAIPAASKNTAKQETAACIPPTSCRLM